MTCLVLIDTGGKQRFIFSTNRRRLNVGASQLVVDVTKTMVAGACEVLGIVDDKIIVNSSGKALVLVASEADGQALVTQVTRQALHDAPGLEVTGAVTPPFDETVDKDFASAVIIAHGVEARVRAKRPGSDLRFLRLPVVADCVTTGGRAAFVDRPAKSEEPEPMSSETRAKYRAAERAFERLGKMMDTKEKEMRDAVDRLAGDGEADDRLAWVGIVHADGNRFGTVFLDFVGIVGKANAQREGNGKERRTYGYWLRAFSRALDHLAQQALRDTVAELREVDASLAVLPLIVGGDDLTVVCDGRYALTFAARYLEVFETLLEPPDNGTATGGPDPCFTEEDRETVLTIAKVSPQLRGRLSACAGVAVVKPHFPFSSAYSLADDLIAEAKKAVRNHVRDDDGPLSCSAIAFHVLHDSSDVDFKAIRDRARRAIAGGDVEVFAGPYVTTPNERLGCPKGGEAETWVKRRQFSLLEGRAKLVRRLDLADGDESHRLPRSQVARLRSALFDGRAVADATYAELCDEYGQRGTPVESLGDPTDSTNPLFWCDDETDPQSRASRLANWRPSLFWCDDETDPQSPQVTGLLDAIDAGACLSGTKKGDDARRSSR